MKQVRGSRIAMLFVPIMLAIGACSDTNGPAGSVSGRESSSSNGAGNTGGSDNSSGQQRIRTAADSFALTVHVGRAADANNPAHDVPVHGASVALFTNVWTFIQGKNGSDTVAGHYDKFASATTDANGDVHFSQLPANIYLIQADGPDGSGLQSASTKSLLWTVANVDVSLFLTNVR
jgi:hypothetical protein